MKYLNITKLTIILFALSISTMLSAQKQSDLDLLYWSAKERITLDDFGVKTNDASMGLSSAGFSLEYNVHGLSFTTKNFNKKVRHCMVRSASQIDTSGDVDRYIQFQQTLFDITEIYVRQFRKALRENRKKLLFKTDVAEELKDQIIGIDLEYRKAAYTNETNSAKDELKQKEWEKTIQKELNELSDYAYEK